MMGVARCCSLQCFIHGDIDGEVVVRDGLLGLQQSGSYHLCKKEEKGGRREEEEREGGEKWEKKRGEKKRERKRLEGMKD